MPEIYRPGIFVFVSVSVCLSSGLSIMVSTVREKSEKVSQVILHFKVRKLSCSGKVRENQSTRVHKLTKTPAM